MREIIDADRKRRGGGGGRVGGISFLLMVSLH